MRGCRAVFSGSYRVVLRSMLLLVSAALLSMNGSAQVSTASVNGVVRDATGAVIANASIVLRNLDTAVDNTTTTNKSGVYSIVSVKPGRYSLEATSAGFSPKRIDALSLTVSQIATLDFTLTVGSQSAVVTVQASSAAQLNLSDASLGTVIGTRQTNDLPLNGRNFTELLTLTPGVSSVNTAQNSGGGFSTPSVITAEVIIPAINGQGNRSNIDRKSVV